MIKVLKGKADAHELAAIEQALRLRESGENSEQNYGKPILRAPFEIIENNEN